MLPAENIAATFCNGKPFWPDLGPIKDMLVLVTRYVQLMYTCVAFPEEAARTLILGTTAFSCMDSNISATSCTESAVMSCAILSSWICTVCGSCWHW